MSGERPDDPSQPPVEASVQDELREELEASEPDNEGSMGVSSNRAGPTGGGGEGAMGTRDTSVGSPDAGSPPEQSAGGEEENPDGLTPKAGYSSEDPRSDQ